MKLAGLLLALGSPALASAQAYQPPQPFMRGVDAVRGQDPDYNAFLGNGGDETPTMRRQREKRIAAFRQEVVDVLAADDGTLTDEGRAHLFHEWRKLRYRSQ